MKDTDVLGDYGVTPWCMKDAVELAVVIRRT